MAIALAKEKKKESGDLAHKAKYIHMDKILTDRKKIHYYPN